MPEQISVPPIGLRPRKFVEERRFVEVYDAIKRYDAAGLEVPAAWHEEFKELHARLVSYGSYLVIGRENDHTIP